MIILIIPGVDFKPLAYINGKILPFEESNVSIWDLGFLFGVSALEVIGVREGKLFKLNEHVDRLYDTARCLFIEIPMSKEEVKEAIKETCRANEHRNGTVAIWVTAGVGTPWWPTAGKPSVIIFPAPSEALFPADTYKRGINVITSSVIRPPPRSIDPQLKCGGSYVSSYLASMQALNAGAQGPIMLDARGFVAEGPAENLFIVKSGEIITPTTANILKGITRRVVIDLAREKGYVVEERDFTMSELYGADEVFFAGTSAEIIPIVKADGREIGEGRPGQVTMDILRHCRELVKQGTPV